MVRLSTVVTRPVTGCVGAAAWDREVHNFSHVVDSLTVDRYGSVR
jgi:hypothetical protein